jgi:hypothetical protein
MASNRLTDAADPFHCTELRIMNEHEAGVGHTSGCEPCKTAIYSSRMDALSLVATSAVGPQFLYRCTKCTTYWEKNLREVHPITEEAARRAYPGAFAQA